MSKNRESPGELSTRRGIGRRHALEARRCELAENVAWEGVFVNVRVNGRFFAKPSKGKRARSKDQGSSGLRTLNAAEIAGLRAVVVDAKDEAAKALYQRYGFEPFRDEPMRLWLMLKDVRGQVG